jgi:hypothetical protein
MIALIDGTFTEMFAYYRMFSCDETWTGHIEIQARDVHRIDLPSFEQLLVHLRDYLRRGYTEFLVGMHGAVDQLPYPIIAGTDVATDLDALTTLQKAADGGDGAKRDALSWESVRFKRRVFANAGRLDRLLEVLGEIRRSRIDHLEIRGCNIGAGTCLEALHKCLNSKYTVAPTVTFFSGMLRTSPHTNTAAQLRHAISTLGPSNRVFSQSDCLLPSSSHGSPDDPALALRWTEVSVRPHRFDGAVRALSPAAILGWAKTYLENSFYYPVGKIPPGGGYRRGGNLPIIGMWTPGKDKPFLFPGDGFDYLKTLATQVSP